MQRQLKLQFNGNELSLTAGQLNMLIVLLATTSSMDALNARAQCEPEADHPYSVAAAQLPSRIGELGEIVWNLYMELMRLKNENQ